MNFKAGHKYRVTRPDGSSFLFDVDEIRDGWVYGRASGGYVGALKRSNVGLYKTNRFFRAEEIAA